MKELNIDLLSLKDEVVQRKKPDGKEYLFDIIRKKEVRALPEEWVRQLIIRHLIEKENYPASHIQVEKQLVVNGVGRRFDILVYDRDTQPFLIVECKSFKVDLGQRVFDQAALYNLKGMAPYLWVSNGLKNLVCAIKHSDKDFEFLDTLPRFPVK